LSHVPVAVVAVLVLLVVMVFLLLMLQNYLLPPTVLCQAGGVPPQGTRYAGSMRTEYVEAVLALVQLVPPGSAVAYGDVAELLGSGGARQVGSVMSHHGSSVPWWRVLRANGEAPQGLETEALNFYIQEGTPLLGRYLDFLRTGEGRWRVDLTEARWAPVDGDFDLIDLIAERLERRLHKMSAPDDEMTV
jgi:alkylated DNA nucleotide flippase Atl1